MSRKRGRSRSRSADHHRHDYHRRRRSSERRNHHNNANHATDALRTKSKNYSRRRSRSREKSSRFISDSKSLSLKIPPIEKDSQKKNQYPPMRHPEVAFHVILKKDELFSHTLRDKIRGRVRKLIPQIREIYIPNTSSPAIFLSFPTLFDIPKSLFQTRIHQFEDFKLEHFNAEEILTAGSNIVDFSSFDQLLEKFKILEGTKLKKYCMESLVNSCKGLCGQIHLETQLEKDFIRKKIESNECPNGDECKFVTCFFKHNTKITKNLTHVQDFLNQISQGSAQKNQIQQASGIKTNILAPKFVVDAVYSFILGKENSRIQKDDLNELYNILPQSKEYLLNSFEKFFGDNPDLFSVSYYTKPVQIQALSKNRNQQEKKDDEGIQNISNFNSTDYFNSQGKSGTRTSYFNNFGSLNSKSQDTNITNLQFSNLPISYYDCKICNRRFKSLESLKYHEDNSALHLTNLEQARFKE